MLRQNNDQIMRKVLRQHQVKTVFKIKSAYRVSGKKENYDFLIFFKCTPLYFISSIDFKNYALEFS